MGIVGSLHWVVMKRVAGKRGMGQTDEEMGACSGLDETKMATGGWRCMDLGAFRSSVVMPVAPSPDTGPIVNAGPAATPAAAEETALVPPGGLIEWNGRDTI
ncbi:hypothetical protein MRB53_027301 [Persea americana]|uniref:Uncharacterized protein n=1 Tax=Persea americana TaxID=3435 RepID=A0ACC2LL09_PERAE|nr:hypothetical protein MRB53_027301 [Persea americana]